MCIRDSCCTCENQNRADYRLPVFLELPIKHRTVIHEPMLEPVSYTHLQNFGALLYTSVKILVSK